MLNVEKYDNVDGGGLPVMFFNGFAADEENETSNVWFLDYAAIPRRRRTPRIDVTDEYLRRDNSVVDSGVKRWGTNSDSDDGEERKKKQKISKNATQVLIGLEPPPNMPEEFKNCIKGLGGNDVRLVIQKIIYPTDISKAHNRFSMTASQLRNRFLSQAEERKVKNAGIMSVILVQPCLQVSEIHFTSWVSGSSVVYIFKTEWNEVVRNNSDRLKKRAVVQVWSFRVGAESQLGFAIVKVRDGVDD